MCCEPIAWVNPHIKAEPPLPHLIEQKIVFRILIDLVPSYLDSLKVFRLVNQKNSKTKFGNLESDSNHGRNENESDSKLPPLTKPKYLRCFFGFEPGPS